MAEQRDIDQALDAAMAAHQAGRHSEAEAQYRALLDAVPDQSDALNLLGLLCFETDRTAEGLAMIEHAIELVPDSLAYRANHAAVLADADRFAEAADAYNTAIALAPDRIELYLDRAGALEAAGDLMAAIETLETARRLAPDHDQLCVDLARLLPEADRGAEAVDLMQAVLTRHPDVAELHLHLGQLLQGLYRMDEAAAAYGSAIALDDTDPLPYYRLGRCLAEKGDWLAAIDAYEATLARHPDHADTLLYLARALSGAEQIARAIEVCERAYELEPDFRNTDMTLGLLYMEAGRHAEAATLLEDAVRGRADGISVSALAQSQLAAGDAVAAKRTAEAYLSRDPGNTHVLVILSPILEVLGERDAVRRLVDFDRLVMARQIGPPDGFDSLDAFNAALAEHVLAHPSLTLSPPRNATREGYHSGELFEEPMGPFAAFQTVLEDAIADYVAALAVDADHPFRAGMPKEWWLNAWAIVLDGPGHQISHAHNTAWMSGVYYVQLPEVMQSDNAEKAGWIEFGPPPPDFPVSLAPETRFFEPAVGTMFLFPGYMFHRTVPTGVSERRISIAFNVIGVPE